MIRNAAMPVNEVVHKRAMLQMPRHNKAVIQTFFLEKESIRYAPNGPGKNIPTAKREAATLLPKISKPLCIALSLINGKLTKTTNDTKKFTRHIVS